MRCADGTSTSGRCAPLATLAVVAAIVLAGCGTRPPAPVVDRAPSTTPKAATETPRGERPDTYTVRKGDTLYSIALDKGVDWRDLAAWNELSDPTRLQTGQVLALRAPGASATAPTNAAVQVSPITGAGAIQARPLGGESAPPASTPGPAGASSGLLKTEPKGTKLPYSEENLAALRRLETAGAPVPQKAEPAPPAKVEPAKPPEAVPQGAPTAQNAEDGVEWSWPAAGKVLSGFTENGTKGLDIAGKVGEPVYASAAGKVVYSGTGLRGYGKLIIIKHSEKYLSAYAHNSQILVKEGQSVTKGQKIAEIGSTDADQPKLHFEIRRFGKPVDPLQFLPGRS